MTAAIVLTAAGSSAITSAWHLLVVPAIERGRERAELRRNCSHSWGDPYEVIPGHGQRFYKRSCSKCGAQLDVNADGTPYIPLHERDDK